MITETDKLDTALNILKDGVFYTFRGIVVNEETFNTIEWATGVDEIGSTVFTTTNPHSEITWTKVKAEMDKL